jgi:hypothetical protein
VLSCLLRKHFEGQLRRLQNRGFVLEADRRTNRRAYFFGEGGSPRKLVYDTPVRRNVEREVVKQRGQHPRVWFENEGIAYEVARLGTLWGVRVKPFYMFTGPDAQTPLPGYARTAKAARRMKYDRNQSVESDLTFWARLRGIVRPPALGILQLRYITRLADYLGGRRICRKASASLASLSIT